jgi:hypothetical protein
MSLVVSVRMLKNSRPAKKAHLEAESGDSGNSAAEIGQPYSTACSSRTSVIPSAAKIKEQEGKNQHGHRPVHLRWVVSTRGVTYREEGCSQYPGLASDPQEAEQRR